MALDCISIDKQTSIPKLVFVRLEPKVVGDSLGTAKATPSESRNRVRPR